MTILCVRSIVKNLVPSNKPLSLGEGSAVRFANIASLVKDSAEQTIAYRLREVGTACGGGIFVKQSDFWIAVTKVPLRNDVWGLPMRKLFLT